MDDPPVRGACTIPVVRQILLHCQREHDAAAVLLAGVVAELVRQEKAGAAALHGRPPEVLGKHGGSLHVLHVPAVHGRPQQELQLTGRGLQTTKRIHSKFPHFCISHAYIYVHI
jgi:hypothetical protein